MLNTATANLLVTVYWQGLYVGSRCVHVTLRVCARARASVQTSKITSEPSHPAHFAFQVLHSGERNRSITFKTGLL